MNTKTDTALRDALQDAQAQVDRVRDLVTATDWGFGKLRAAIEGMAPHVPSGSQGLITVLVVLEGLQSQQLDRLRDIEEKLDHASAAAAPRLAIAEAA